MAAALPALVLCGVRGAARLDRTPAPEADPLDVSALRTGLPGRRAFLLALLLCIVLVGVQVVIHRLVVNPPSAFDDHRSFEASRQASSPAF